MKPGSFIALAAGLIGFAWLVLHFGVHQIVAAAISVGWAGIALLSLCALSNFALQGAGWAFLVPPYNRRRLFLFIWGRALRDAAAQILPYSDVGGMVIAARATTLFGLSAAEAYGSTIVDITLELFGEIAFVILGLAILVTRLSFSPEHLALFRITVVGVCVALFGAVGFVIAQRRGFAVVERLAERFVPSAAVGAAALNEAIQHTYGRRLAMMADMAIHLAGWIAAAFGTWLTLWLMGTPLSFPDAIAIESLLCATRSALVFIPSAVGVQEAGYAMMLPLFGLAPGLGIALSLVRRAQQIATGVPIILSWQIAEGSRAMKKDPSS